MYFKDNFVTFFSNTFKQKFLFSVLDYENLKLLKRNCNHLKLKT
jgi:hypothetical protein